MLTFFVSASTCLGIEADWYSFFLRFKLQTTRTSCFQFCAKLKKRLSFI
jgi:hypothetical protein